MKKQLSIFILVSTLLLSTCSCSTDAKVEVLDSKKNKEVEKMNYYMPAEDLPHEGTWITWPHQYTYGIEYQNEIEDIWLQMVEALHTGEMVHIVAYNKNEKSRIEKLLTANELDMNKIDFIISKSNDVWIRDTGPMFVFDKNDNLAIANFDFDGWGKKVPYASDNNIPIKAGKQKNIPVIDIPDFVLEGGSIEIDGNGTLMATLSSVVSKNRNSDFTIKQAEEYLKQYLGVTNFIWLDGVTDEDVTDAHIDGISRFIDDKSILTVSKDDFAQLYEEINMDDYDKMLKAKNVDGKKYEIIELPLTQKNVDGLDYKGSYLNYYIGNEVVIVPVYDDENDELATEIISKLYPEREIIPIVVNSLYQYGGMIHCVTQQQPI